MQAVFIHLSCVDMLHKADEHVRALLIALGSGKRCAEDGGLLHRSIDRIAVHATVCSL